MVYTGESGSVWKEVVLQKTNMSGLSDYIGYAHTSETDAIIRENHSYAVTSTTGKVSFWMFGKLQEEYTVPADDECHLQDVRTEGGYLRYQ